MKLQKLFRRAAAALLSGAMLLSLCTPALAEAPASFSNTLGIGLNKTKSLTLSLDADGTYRFSAELTNGTTDVDTGYDYIYIGSEAVYHDVTLTLDGTNGTAANPARFTLEGLHIDNSGSALAPLTIKGHVELELDSEAGNDLTGNSTCAAVVLTDGSTLTITGSGTLRAENIADGGSAVSGSGALVMNGGTLTAQGGPNGSVISVASFTASGGTVEVNGSGAPATRYYGICTTDPDNTLSISGGKVSVMLTGGKGIGTRSESEFSVSGGSVDIAASGEGCSGLSANSSGYISGGSVDIRVSGQDCIGIGNSSTFITGGKTSVHVQGDPSARSIYSMRINVSDGTLNVTGTGQVSGIGPYETIISGGTVSACGIVGDAAISGSARVTVSPDASGLWFNNNGAETAPNYSGLTTGYIRCVDKDGNFDHTIPEGSGIDPTLPETSTAAPSGNAGGALAAVALGGAAVWGGYEAATRIILHKLLPEGAAIPKNQAELAVLLWNTAGQPEPVNTPAFADVDETTAKAAQWCTEQGLLDSSFAPAKRVTKYRVIRVWKQAFPTG